MRFDEGPTRPAPGTFPYDHPSLAFVWEQEERLNARHEAAKVQAAPSEPEPAPLAPAPAPAAPPPRKIPTASRDERLAIMSAEKAFERFTRGDW